MGLKQILEKVEIVEAPEQAKQYICSIHKKDDGYITVVVKNKLWNQWHYKKTDLINILGQLTNIDNDVYISVNDFYKPKRSVESLIRINALYMDIDCHNSIYRNNINGLINYLYEEFFEKKIPTPNIIINSGRGIHLLWTIEDLPKQGLPLWQIVQQKIYTVLQQINYEGFEADPSVVSDVARVLRLPETINTKSKAKTKIIYLNDKFDYRLDEIIKYYFPELQIVEKKQTKKVAKKTTKKNKKQTKNETTEENKVKFLFNKHTLNYNRLLDIVKLAEIRKYDLKGHRELFCFLYRYYNIQYCKNTEIALNNVLEFNKQFTEPLSDREVKAATKSAEKAYQEYLLDEKKGYNYKNETLIRLLNITPEEQQELNTIIGTNEKERRHNIQRKKTRRNANGLTKKQQEMADLKAKILTLKETGLSLRKIAEELNITLGKVQRCLKK